MLGSPSLGRKGWQRTAASPRRAERRHLAALLTMPAARLGWNSNDFWILNYASILPHRYFFVLAAGRWS